VIENSDLEAIFESATDISVVCEIYASSATPGATGFDPANALACYAGVSGIEFKGATYQELLTQIGSVRVSTDGSVSTTSVTLSNVTREVADFELNGGGYEGLILVIRTISRSQSATLAKSKIEFVGRCEKPSGGNRESITLEAKSITGSIEVLIPRRKYGKDDLEGRPPTHPEFEGFVHMPYSGTVNWDRREKKGGFLGWWNKRWVRHTLNWSSYSLLDANKFVAEVLGSAQMLGVLIGAADVGIYIQMVVAWCEGEVEGPMNVRSIDPALPLDATMTHHYGKVGVLNGDGPNWVANAYYSRTSNSRLRADNTAIDVNDEAPDVAAVIKGRKMKTPKTSNVWSGFVWTDDPAAHVRFLYTDPNYYNLDEAWIDDVEFGNCYWFNNELIFNSEVSDFTFVDEG
jgi:hypothetical protein